MLMTAMLLAKVMIKGAGLMEEGTRLHVVAAIISGIVAIRTCMGVSTLFV